MVADQTLGKRHPNILLDLQGRPEEDSVEDHDVRFEERNGM